MAKTAARSTLSPNLFSVGQGVVIEDIQSVVEQLNYSMSSTPHVLWQVQCEPAGWGSAGTELETTAVQIASASYVTLYRGHVWIDPDAQQLSIYLEVFADTGNTVEVQVTIGSDFDSTTWTATTSEQTLPLATSTTGTGWQQFTVQARRTAGSADTNRLRSARIVVDAWAALPDAPGQVTVTAPSGFSNTTSVSLDGTDAYIQTADHADLDLTSALTFSGWFRVTTLATNETFASKWSFATQGGWVLQTSGTNANRLWLFLATTLTDNGTGCRIGTTANVLSNNTWHHIAWTFNAGTVALYVDGSAVTTSVESGSTPSALLANTAALRVGAWSGTLTRYLGPANVDEVALFDTALSASEITSLYNSGSPADISAHARWGDCVLWWRCGDGDTHPTLTDQRAGGGGATTSHDGTLVNGLSSDFVSQVP